MALTTEDFDTWVAQQPAAQTFDERIAALEAWIKENQ